MAAPEEIDADMLAEPLAVRCRHFQSAAPCPPILVRAARSSRRRMFAAGIAWNQLAGVDRGLCWVE